MRIVDLETAQMEMDELIDRACAGEEIVISQDGKPVARLIGLPESMREPGDPTRGAAGRV
jgi:prevent-host-death family protein